MAECPDCGARLNRGRNHLTSDEYTETLDCPECPFGLESMSNVVWRERFDGGDAE